MTAFNCKKYLSIVGALALLCTGASLSPAQAENSETGGSVTVYQATEAAPEQETQKAEITETSSSTVDNSASANSDSEYTENYQQ